MTGEKATEKGEAIKTKYGVDDKKEIMPHMIPFVRRYFGESQDIYFSGEFYDIADKVYTDHNIKKDKLAKDGVKSIKEIDPRERKEMAILQDNRNKIDKASKKLKELREAEKEYPKKFTNSKDLQAAINANNKVKYSVYKQVFKYYKESQEKLKKLKKV